MISSTRMEGGRLDGTGAYQIKSRSETEEIVRKSSVHRVVSRPSEPVDVVPPASEGFTNQRPDGGW